MKIAVLGDIHGNLEALEAVLADLDAAAPEVVFCTGDVVGYCANPRECLAIARERLWPTVMGNWELVVAPEAKVSPEEFNPYARASAYWTREVLTDEEREYLGRLPDCIVEEGVQIVHGFTGEAKSTRYLVTAEDARAAFGAAEAGVVFLGHTHLQITFFDSDPITFTNDHRFVIDGGVKTIVNTGAVGQPRDQDVRASYCLYDTVSRELVVRRCEYDVNAAAKKIVDAGLPEILATRLTLGK